MKEMKEIQKDYFLLEVYRDEIEYEFCYRILKKVSPDVLIDMNIRIVSDSTENVIENAFLEIALMELGYGRHADKNNNRW
jgi:hypothetical protein